MSLDPGTILSIIDLVQRAITIYKAVDDLPQQMSQLGKRMETLNVFLASFSTFVKGHPRTTQKQDLTLYLKNIEENVEKVHDLFDRYQKGIVSRSHDLDLRFRWATSMWFSLIDNSPEKIQAIMDEIEHYTNMLNNYMTLELLRLTQAALQPKPAPKATTPATKKPPQTAPKAPSPSPTTKPSLNPRPPPAASTTTPAPPRPSSRTGLSLLVIDPSNTGRSLQAEALLRLLAHRFPPFPFTKIHSAGFFVRDTAADSCAAAIARLDYALPMFQKPITPSGAPPQAEALAGVFGLGGDGVPEVRKAFEGRGSRGVRRGVFGYDFVAVFTKRELVNLGKLRKALGGEGKARLVHLGDYKGEGFREIGVPKKMRGGKENWVKKAEEICTALEGFLKKEVKWVPPVAIKNGALAAA
ncbi:hypothetical protein B0H67DRAFT_487888 [Lasiosphaeris hirsuta]|uniref:Uncharacterized protein n=1 Tax=Lasiosphaeris hirsuta TaxID=260670 RepID=A0AA40AF85_9PEZI|nr:hypothetical protein B0H67DRAFT_487888 [Lasiosphaeris hirsuta]